MQPARAACLPGRTGAYGCRAGVLLGAVGTVVAAIVAMLYVGMVARGNGSLPGVRERVGVSAAHIWLSLGMAGFAVA